MIPDSLHSPRLELRLLASTTEDAQFLLELMNTPGWLTYIGDRKVHSPEDALLYIENIQRHAAYHYFVVSLREGGSSIGIITYLKRTHLEYPDLGFAFLPSYQLRGFAQEAAGAFLQWLRSATAVSTICAITRGDNTASIRLLSHLGFMLDQQYTENGESMCLFLLKLHQC